MQINKWGLSLAALLPVVSPAEAQKKSVRPNIILINADDLGYGDVSCNGATRVQTPNVDRIAREGVRHTNMHATSATSTPSRFSLLTGCYAWRVAGTGIAPGDAAMIVTPEMNTLPKMLQRAGYTTAAVGKWHLGLGRERGKQDWNGEITPGLKDIGFDYSFIMAATADRVPCVYIENGRVVGLDPSDPIQVDYAQPFEDEPTGRDNPELLTVQHSSHGHDQAVVHGVGRIGYMKGGKAALWNDADLADRITEKAVDFLRKQASDQPFFLYFATNDVHVPRVPHARFVGATDMGPRGDAIVSFDWSVGEVLRLVDSLGIADHTLIVLTSDNGPVVDDGYQDQSVERLGDHRPWGAMRGGKYSIFEAGTCVPTVVRYPKVVQAGTVGAAGLSHIDLFASLAALVGQPLVEGEAPDSQDQLQALLGKDKKGRGWLVLDAHTRSVTTSDGWKYIAPSKGAAYSPLTRTEYGNDPLPQLYYLRTDPAEQHNVAVQNPQRVAELSAKLLEVSAPL